MYAWYDSWMVNYGYCENLACELNETVGVKVAWYWHDLKSHNYGWREMVEYGTTEKEMKKGELSRDSRWGVYI